MADAAASTWPTHEFIFVNASWGTPIPYPVASNTGFSGDQAKQVAIMETYLREVALHFQGLGFAAPSLERVEGRNGGEAWVVRLHDYPDTETHARYATNAGYLEVDLSRAFTDGEVSDETMEALAHELFHGVQRSYLHSDQLAHGNWITEGQAQAVGMDTARVLRGVDVYWGENDDYRLGGREYSSPLSTEIHDETYRTASFWRYLAELGAPPEPDYRYLAGIYSNPFSGPNGENADLEWLDAGLRQLTGEGLAFHYAHFAVAIADYLPARLTKEKPVGSPQQVADTWLNRLFGPCPTVTLDATEASGTTTALLRKNAARCFKVEIEKSEAATSQRATTGAEFLNRIRGKSKENKVDLAVQARATDRPGLEALWLGMAGSEDVLPAYVGRDREGYVAYWKYSLVAGEPRTFILSNVAEDPTRSLNQDLPLTLITSSARMNSASSGLGALVGGPIDLHFDRFPTRDILAADSEYQIKAGIERPCMLRMHLKSSQTDAEFYLQMDNDGPIKPGSFQAEQSPSSEEVPGRFVAGVSFGRGRDRVSYRAEAGTMELTAFSPGLLKGTVSLSGRLPDRVFGQEASPWPETITVRTEFTLVPRVNLDSSLFKRNYCFE